MKTPVPAFPVFHNPDAPSYSGMALRDYFAIKILQGLMLRHKEPGYSDSSAIFEAYELANKMLDIREVKK